MWIFIFCDNRDPEELKAQNTEVLHIIYFYFVHFIFCSDWDGTQDFTLARQALCHCTTPLAF